ncbi:MAG: DNA-processing protein DprA [Chloroflexota bacterium]|nr:MAG: DNA-processing protein DprA [Chloroflexota bacterium]
MSEPRQYWVAFSLVKGIGAVRFQALLDYFGDPQIAWNAPSEALRQAGLSDKVIENVVNLRSSIDLDLVWKNLENEGISVLIQTDDNYPRRLKEIDQSPPVIYTLGELKSEDEWAVAVVGTRRITAYGRQIAEDVAGTLARNGITVVSGLARGVDSIAHQAALQNSGRTIAVLGSGLDRIYPPENKGLAEQIANQGVLISDYPPGTPPEASNFPPRNRLISGLSLAVVIVEAGQTSGALITAAFAADQGREVFAVPGNINSPGSKGTNRLILDGAQPLLHPDQVLEELELTMVAEQRTARVILPADAVEAQLFDVLGQEPLHIDEIRSRTDLPIEKVIATLALMELKGMVRQVGGMQYVVLRELREGYGEDDKIAS